MQQPIYISSVGSISPLGHDSEMVWKAYQDARHYLSRHDGNLVSALSEESLRELDQLRQSNPKYRQLDKSVLMAIYAARQAVQKTDWGTKHDFGINIGSSRGATELFEKFHSEFLETQKSQPLSSPTTTLGNISSWVAHDLQTEGPEISHSITCSTALHALLNGVAWIRSGLCERFLVGGSEAPLTDFTIAQMRALKIYSNNLTNDFPCRALDIEKSKNSMVLGEGASVVCLEKDNNGNALAKIIGLGYATEVLEHNASLSTDAVCFQKSMKMALKDLDPEEIDVIVTHSPGTIKGDQAEINAIKTVFCNKIPTLTTNKWKLGHSLGASGLQSLEMALYMIQNQRFVSVPFLNHLEPQQLNRIMINAVGFGGNAVSVIISN